MLRYIKEREQIKTTTARFPVYHSLALMLSRRLLFEKILCLVDLACQKGLQYITSQRECILRDGESTNAPILLCPDDSPA
jgi:hypothetical protein